ncbi:MAG: N-acetyl-gamma-glutamyl-phosphate reductase [Eubacterium sp.]|nr:N-acetyl-gamma-glutamyl-phosphate reductase [Eubacterium sp.]
MIKAGIVGATGYAGGELVRILYAHKEVEIKWLYSKSYEGQTYSDIYRNMSSMADVKLVSGDLGELSKEVDVIFTATPQGYLASVLNEEILKNSKVIDLSADFRIKDVKTYEKWYGIEHKSPQFIGEAVYGLCEKNREDIRYARLIANPGCYPTCSFLSIYPAAAEHIIDVNTIIIDAKSGTSGAGRGAKVNNLYCEVNENIKAYGLPNHRHTPEIEEQISYASGESVLLNFSPHLVPMNRGILVTAYASLNQKSDGSYYSEDEIREIYEKYYNKEKFVRVLKKGVCPETRWVEGSNFTDVNILVDDRTHRLIMMGALDNIVKGAAGQAVQNMNIMFGFKEEEGLEMPPVFP